MKIAVIGLGYVGLPLAVEFGKIYETFGFDLSDYKVNCYKKGIDPNGELSETAIRESTRLSFHHDAKIISQADIVIVAVPTPVGKANQPNFEPLITASKLVGQNIKKGSIIVYESTVYPGATEEICIPIIEKYSGYKWKEDFNVGYSPERINPGDLERGLKDIVKVVSGDTENTLEILCSAYEKIIVAGVYRAQSIEVAEACKVIENTQRDLNIALINELAIIFNKIGIDTEDVLNAAGTKWNFLPFRPGLVGGHCIGVDPYYLTYKASLIGYHPEVILAGRRINDGMSSYIASQLIKLLINRKLAINGAKVLVMGVTFKENCVDIRNSKVIDLIEELKQFGCEVSITDPIANPIEVSNIYGLNLIEWEKVGDGYDVLISAVPHLFFKEMPEKVLLSKLVVGGIFADIKSSYDRESIKKLGYQVWRL